MYNSDWVTFDLIYIARFISGTARLDMHTHRMHAVLACLIIIAASSSQLVKCNLKKAAIMKKQSDANLSSVTFVSYQAKVVNTRYAFYPNRTVSKFKLIDRIISL